MIRFFVMADHQRPEYFVLFHPVWQLLIAVCDAEVTSTHTCQNKHRSSLAQYYLKWIAWDNAVLLEKLTNRSTVFGIPFSFQHVVHTECFTCHDWTLCLWRLIDAFLTRLSMSCDSCMILVTLVTAAYAHWLGSYLHCCHSPSWERSKEFVWLVWHGDI